MAIMEALPGKVGRVSETYSEDTAHDVAPILNGAVAQRPRVAAFAEYLLARAQATPTKQRALEVSVNQVEAILAASEDGSDDDIWDADRGGTIGLRDIPGAVIRIHSIEISEANDPAYEADLGVFALIYATMLYDPERNYPAGSDVVINTGVGRVITKLRAFEARDRFPMDAMVTAIKSQSGFVLRLDRAPNYPMVADPIQ